MDWRVQPRASAMTEFADATREHARIMAPNLRSMDVKEAYSASGMTPLGALLASLMHSEESYTAFLNDEPVAMFGVSAAENKGIGVPWLLGTPAMERIPVTIVKMGRELCQSWAPLYGTLINAVHWQNTKSLCWLPAIGFEMVGVLPNYGVQQERFYMYALNV